MSELDINKIIELVEAGHTKEATKIFSDFIDGLPASDRGKAYVDLAAAYLRLQAENNETLMRIMDSHIEKLKDLDELEGRAAQDVSDAVELDDIRKKLK